MSSPRSRSGGTSIGNTASRKNRSPRNSPALDGGFQIFISCGHYANINRHRRASADTIDDLLFDGAQQFSLHAERQLADLIEKYCTA